MNRYLWDVIVRCRSYCIGRAVFVQKENERICLPLGKDWYYFGQEKSRDKVLVVLTILCYSHVGNVILKVQMSDRTRSGGGGWWRNERHNFSVAAQSRSGTEHHSQPDGRTTHWRSFGRWQVIIWKMELLLRELWTLVDAAPNRCNELRCWF